MNTLNQVLYTAHVSSIGGRSGFSESEDGRLQVQLSAPKELGGDGGTGTNPEQMFAAGYSACFIGAMQHVAAAMKITLPESTKVNADVAIGPIENGFGLAVALEVELSGLEQAVAEKLVEAAHQVCPYSNATRGNIEVTLSVKTQ